MHEVAEEPMAHRYRFHVPAEELRAGRVMLPKEEAHHASRVARLPEGEEVDLFDGEGRLGRGRIAAVGRNTVGVDVEAVESLPRQARRIGLLVAWPNHAKCTEEIVRRATEFEAERAVFFHGARSERGPLLKEKFARVAVESAKQCGAVWLPALATAESFGEALDAYTGTVFVAHLDADGAREAEAPAAGDAVALAIGPEGGFAESEIDDARVRGARFISLGPNTLRTEIAVCAGLARLRGMDS
jgi:16S rRNA (uracil1498-N3)-methyltransferase